MMNVVNASTTHSLAEGPAAKKSLDDFFSQLVRKPLMGRNTIDHGQLDRVAAKASTFVVSKSKDYIKATKPKSVLSKKPAKTAFAVPLPKTHAEPVPAIPIKLIADVPENVTQIDILGSSSFNCPIYAQPIVDYNLEREKRFALKPDFLETSAITPKSRSILVDWLIQVQSHADISTESLHIAIALLDRMLTKRNVSLQKLQLIGVVCLFIACKINERFPPEIQELLRLTENAYNKSDLLAAERLVLKTLGFDLLLPNPMVFVDRLTQASKDQMGDQWRQVQAMAHYILQLGLTDARFSALLPSQRASAAFWVARKLLLPPVVKTWNPSLQWYSSYSQESLTEVTAFLAKIILKAPQSKFQGARVKYASNSRYGRISHHSSLDNLYVLRSIASQ